MCHESALEHSCKFGQVILPPYGIYSTTLELEDGLRSNVVYGELSSVGHGWSWKMLEGWIKEGSRIESLLWEYSSTDI